jgi:hypothetical protein
MMRARRLHPDARRRAPPPAFGQHQAGGASSAGSIARTRPLGITPTGRSGDVRDIRCQCEIVRMG